MLRITPPCPSTLNTRSPERRPYTPSADDCARAGNQAGAWGWGDDAYSERMAAKRLRNLATRAEGER